MSVVIGTGIKVKHNFKKMRSDIGHPSTGVYTIEVDRPCAQALGVTHVNVHRGDMVCFGDFSAANEVTVTCVDKNNNLTNIPTGTTLQVVAYCAVP